MDEGSRLEAEEQQLRQWFHQFGPGERDHQFTLERQELFRRLEPLRRQCHRTAVRRTVIWWTAAASLLILLGVGASVFRSRLPSPSTPHAPVRPVEVLPQSFAYTPYRNTRSQWPFYVLVPSFFKTGVTPQDRDGERWTFGQISVTAYGEWLQNLPTWRQALKGLALGPQGHVLAIHQGPSWETVTGTLTEQGQPVLVYERGTVAGRSLYVLKLVYPQDVARTFSPILHRMVGSFHPGSVNP